MSVQILERHELDAATKQRLPEICSQCEHGSEHPECFDPLSYQHFVLKEEDPDATKAAGKKVYLDPITSIVRVQNAKPTMCYSEEQLKQWTKGAATFRDPATNLPTAALTSWGNLNLQTRIQNAAASGYEVRKLLSEYFDEGWHEGDRSQECFNVLTSMFHPNADALTVDKLLCVVYWMSEKEWVNSGIFWSYGLFLLEMKETYANHRNVEYITYLFYNMIHIRGFNADNHENVVPVVSHYLGNLPKSLEGVIRGKTMYVYEIKIIYKGVTKGNVNQLIEAGLIKQSIHALKLFNTLAAAYRMFNKYALFNTINNSCAILINVIRWNAVSKHVLIGEGGREYVSTLSTFIRNIDGGESEFPKAKELYTLLQ